MRCEFELREKKGIGFFVFPEWEKIPSVTHFFSTRKGGMSVGPCASLNLDYREDDDRETVSRNRTLLIRALESERDIHFVRQTHGEGIHVVSRADATQGNHREVEADAILTDVPDFPIGVLTADCVPILLLDPERKAVGVVHAGRKGTARRILSKTIQKMARHYNTSVERLLVGFGPAIGRCCYEVGEECLAPFQDNPLLSKQAIKEGRNGKYRLDLIRLNLFQVLEFNIPNRNIFHLNLCTSCRTDLFYSHRGERGKTGRFVSGIFLRSR